MRRTKKGKATKREEGREKGQREGERREQEEDGLKGSPSQNKPQCPLAPPRGPLLVCYQATQVTNDMTIRSASENQGS